MKLQEWTEGPGKGFLFREEGADDGLALRLWPVDNFGSPVHRDGLEALGVEFDSILVFFVIGPDGSLGDVYGDGLIDGRSYREVILELDERLKSSDSGEDWTFA